MFSGSLTSQPQAVLWRPQRSHSFFRAAALLLALLLWGSVGVWGQTVISNGQTVNARDIAGNAAVVIEAGGTLNMDANKTFSSLTTRNSGTSTITGSRDLTISGNLILAAGNTLQFATTNNQNEIQGSIVTTGTGTAAISGSIAQITTGTAANNSIAITSNSPSISGTAALTTGSTALLVALGETFTINIPITTTGLVGNLGGSGTGTFAGTGSITTTANLQINAGNGNNTGTLVINAPFTIACSAIEAGAGSATKNFTLFGTVKVSALNAFQVTNGSFGVLSVATGSTFEYNGTNNQNVVSGIYSNLVASGSGIKSAGINPITVNARLSVESNATLDMSTTPLRGNNLTTSGTGTLTTQNTTDTALPANRSWSFTVAYSSASPQTIVAGNYTNLNGTGGNRTLPAGTTIGIAGTFTPGAGTYTTTGSTVNYNGSSAQTVSPLTYNHLTLSTQGSVTMSEGISVAGNLVNAATGSVTAPASITFNGTAPQNIAGLAYNSILFSGAGTKTFTSNASVSGTGSLTFASGTGTIDFDGSGNTLVFTLKSDASGTARIGNTNGTSLQGNVVAERYLSVNNTSPRTGRAWRMVSIPVTGTGTLRDFFMGGQNGADLTIAANRDAQPANSGTPIVGHNFANAAAATAAGFDYIGVPNQVSSLRRYIGNPTGGTFNSADVPNLSTTYDAAEQGYIVFARGDRKISFPSATTVSATTLRSTGLLKQGTVTMSVAPAGTSKYTLVGNPYMAVLDLGALYTSNAAVIKPSFRIWDANNVNGSFNQGGYRTVFFNGSSWTDNLGSTNPHLIESGLAFFVEPEAAVSTPTNITITESHKSTSAAGIPTGGFRPLSMSGNLFVRLEMQNTDGSRAVTDGIVAGFDDAYNDGLGDAIDIETMANVSNAPLWLKRGGKRLTVEGRPWPGPARTSLPLGMGSLQAVPYFLKITPQQMTQAGVPAVLRDNYLNTETAIDLSSGLEYGFTRTGTAALDSNRFEIIFNNNVILPVTFTQAQIKQAGTGVELTWQTRNEAVGVRYEVEKSMDAANFANVHQQKGKGGSVANYSWIDLQPAAGSNFYRIKAIGLNGETKYSQVLKWNAMSTSKGWNIYPNPVRGQALSLQLNQAEQGSYTARITDATGRVLLTQRIVHSGGNGNYQVQLPSGLPKGAYNLNIINQNGQFVTALRFVIE